jgi:indolepyruvate ferredoxin oxidoreductase
MLSYKDEYEVARLHTDSAFHDKLRNDFGNSARLRFHLAPPLLGGKRDARGRPLKREFGAWILPLFRVLAKLRRLRGTAFDVFGHTAERRMERQLICEFEATVETVLERLDATNAGEAVDVIEAWLEIRGFGPVKEESVEKTRKRVAELLDDLAESESKAA